MTEIFSLSDMIEISFMSGEKTSTDDMVILHYVYKQDEDVLYG